MSDRPSSLRFVFAAEGIVPAAAAMTFQPDEIAEARWVDQSEAVSLYGAAGQKRMAAVMEARQTGVPLYVAT